MAPILQKNELLFWWFAVVRIFRQIGASGMRVRRSYILECSEGSQYEIPNIISINTTIWTAMKLWFRLSTRSKFYIRAIFFRKCLQLHTIPYVTKVCGINRANQIRITRLFLLPLVTTLKAKLFSVTVIFHIRTIEYLNLLQLPNLCYLWLPPSLRNKADATHIEHLSDSRLFFLKYYN